MNDPVDRPSFEDESTWWDRWLGFLRLLTLLFFSLLAFDLEEVRENSPTLFGHQA